MESEQFVFHWWQFIWNPNARMLQYNWPVAQQHIPKTATIFVRGQNEKRSFYYRYAFDDFYNDYMRISLIFPYNKK